MAGKATRGGILSSRIKSANVKFFPEGILGYLGGPFFALIPNGIINTFLSQYWVNVLGIESWNSVFLWLLPLLSSILIVIGNILVGKLMEGKPRKAGKARPLLVLSVPAIAIAIVACFLAPNPYNNVGAFDNNITLATLIIVAIGYNLFYAFAWPLYYTSHSAMVNLSTRNASQRSLLGTLAMAGQVGAAGVAGMAGGFLCDGLKLLPTKMNLLTTFKGIAESFGQRVSQTISEATIYVNPDTLKSEKPDYSLTALGEQALNACRADANGRWFVIMIVLIAALVIGVALEFLFTRERITEEAFALEAKGEGNQESNVKRVKMADQIKVSMHDKYWWFIILFFFLYQLGGMLKNNGQTFYSQAWTQGDTSLASLIGILGAIPTALGMVVVWPLANKFGKANCIKIGAVLAVLLGFIGWIPLFASMNPATDGGAIQTLSIVGFCAKAIGTVPAMYVSLALMSDVLDHQEAVYGIRTDGFTMAVYGSIMIAMTGISNAIILAINGMFPAGSYDQRFAMTFVFFGGEMLCYLIITFILMFMNVEKFSDLDHEAIEARQKKEAEAAGIEYVPAKIRLEQEQKQAEIDSRNASIEELRLNCEKKGLNFEEELKKFEEAEAVKAEAAAKKKEEAEAKKQAKAAEKAKAEEARRAALTEDQRAAEDAKALEKARRKESEAAKLAAMHAAMIEKGSKVLSK